MRISFNANQVSRRSLKQDEQCFTIKIDMDKLTHKLLQQTSGASPKHIVIELSVTGKDGAVWVKKTQLHEAEEIGMKAKRLTFSVNCGDKLVVRRIKMKKPKRQIESSATKVEVQPEQQFEKYSTEYFLNLIGKLFREYYGQESVELREVPKGRLLVTIKKKIVKVFLSTGLKERDVRRYLKWVFAEKSEKVVLTVPLLASPGIISEFVARKASGNFKTNKGTKYVFR